MKCYLTLVFLILTASLHGQQLTGIATRWNDAFTEWEIYTDDEDVRGEIRMRWPSQLDWTDWSYRLGEETGRIKLKWKEDPNEWEIRGAGALVTARTLWRDDFRNWRISDGKKQLTFKCRYGNRLDEWEIRDDTYGYFEIYTHWENDPREWIIIDELNEPVSLSARIAMAFLATYYSSPKD